MGHFIGILITFFLRLTISSLALTLCTLIQAFGDDQQREVNLVLEHVSNDSFAVVDSCFRVLINQ